MFKRIATAALVLMVSGNLLANKSWDQYHQDQTVAKIGLNSLENGVTSTASVLSVTAQYQNLAVEAQALGRADIAAWDYNNAAYADILTFKSIVNYTEATKSIAGLNAKSTDRLVKVEALQSVYSANVQLLDDAETLLNKALSTNNASDLKSKVKSNLNFIKNIKEFNRTNFK